jgi:hypothetical protein
MTDPMFGYPLITPHESNQIFSGRFIGAKSPKKNENFRHRHWFHLLQIGFGSTKIGLRKTLSWGQWMIGIKTTNKCGLFH